MNCLKIYSSLLLLIIIISFQNEVKASHIVGGEMTYRCLGGIRYEIRLTLRRDCLLGSPEAQFDDPARIGIFDSDGVILRTLGNYGALIVPFRHDDTLNEILKTECEVIGGDVCVHTTTYIGLVELPFRKGGYIFAYQRCCRNSSILNIVDPELSGATYSVNIGEDALRYCNQGPVFKEWPPIYICGDRPIDFDQSVFDAEGDSLVYSLCIPYEGADTANSKPSIPSRPPFPLVTYKAPYSLFNLIGGFPELSIDRKTGRLTGRPDSSIIPAQYLIAVCVSEYRNGRLLSQSRRDFQYNVRICNTNPEAQFETDDTVKCGGDLTVRFRNKSSNENGLTWYFDYPFNTITSRDSNPTITFPKSGAYRVALLAVRKQDCIDTSYQNIYLYDSTLLNADFKTSYGSCDDSIEVFFEDLSYDSLLFLNKWEWNVNINGNTYQSNDRNPRFTFYDTGKATINLVVNSSGGCQDTIQREIYLNRLKPRFISSEIPICIGESTPLISNPDSRFTYTWSPSTGLSCSDCPNPIANPGSTTEYHVTITDGKCVEVDSIEVIVSELLAISIKGDSVICQDTVSLNAVGGVESSIQWSGQRDFSTIIKSGDFDFKTAINGSAKFYVRGVSSSNCPGLDSIEVFNQKVEIFGASNQYKFCEKDTFGLTINNKTPGHNLTYIWQPNSYLLSGQGTDSVTLVIPRCEDQVLTVRAENQYKCSAIDTIGLDILCLPSVDFEFDKTCDNTIVSFINRSAAGNYTWDFGDGTPVSNENNPIHNYLRNGRYVVTLRVNAECQNEIKKVIQVGVIVVTLNDSVTSCQGAPVRLNENADLNFKYIWSPAEFLDNPNSANPLATVDTTTVFKVRVIDESIADCFIEREVIVFVAPDINLTVNNDTILCYSNRMVFQATTSVNTKSIQWTDEVGVLLGEGYQLEQDIRDSMYIIAIATDNYGCSELDSFRVIPIFTDYKINGKQNLCPGASGNIEFVSNNSHRYTLNWSPSKYINNPNNSFIVVSPIDTTVFIVDFVNEYGCSFRDSFQINISRFDPPLDAFADDDTIYLGESTVLHVNSQYTNYEWRVPSNGTLSCLGCIDPIATPTNSILYTVKATNADGCNEEAEVRVIVILPKCNEEDVYIPNIFSPNNDAVNNLFRIRSNFLEEVEMYVYDRWGEKVFETKDLNSWWDGMYKGNLLPPDVYAYYFNVKCVDGNTYYKKGNVTLIR
ncbi:MAG: PKD domain-containing protein [Bacteroidota bacterium]|nr:PKD domain-containing protein [Bacteroidota bacterium]